MAGKVMVCGSSAPVPDNGTACELARLFSALSVKVTLPGRVPEAVGANATAIRHCPAEASAVLELQSVPPEASWVKLVLTTRFDTLNPWLPASVTETTCAALVEPMLVLANVSVAARLRFTS